jgi:hypothetical protein
VKESRISVVIASVWSLSLFAYAISKRLGSHTSSPLRSSMVQPFSCFFFPIRVPDHRRDERAIAFAERDEKRDVHPEVGIGAGGEEGERRRALLLAIVDGRQKGRLTVLVERSDDGAGGDTIIMARPRALMRSAPLVDSSRCSPPRGCASAPHPVS